MKIIFSVLCLFFLSSCAFLTEYTSKYIKVSAVHKSNKYHFFKKKHLPKKTITNSSKKIINKASKDILFKTLTSQQLTFLKNLLNKDDFVLKDKVKVILGKHFYKTENLKIALHYYSKVQQKPFKNWATLEEAKIYHQINRPKIALKLINQLLNKHIFSDNLLIETYLLKISLLLKQKIINKKELLKTYCGILFYKNNNIYKTKIRHLIFQMTEADLLDIKSDDFIEPIKDLVFFRIGKILFYRGEFKQSHIFFKKFLKFSTKSLLENKAIKYIQAIKSRKKVNKTYIGAILPLSGSAAHIGKRSLKGLKIALGIYTKQTNPFKLIVIDNQGLADKTQKAVHTLVTKHHVIAIVGGVLSPTSIVLAKEAQIFGVPTILMSQKSNLTHNKNYIFQNSLTASSIANQLTEFLINHLKIKRFAILYPNDPYGVDYANAFWTAVEQKGGKITGVQFYKPGETDFNGPLRRLVGTYYLSDRITQYKEKIKQWYVNKYSASKKRLTPPKNILPPIIDFEVLFIPDSLKVLNLIAPHIAYNDINNVLLAGPSLWNKKKFFKTSSKYVDNLIFAEPGLSSKKFKKTNFYKKFYNIFSYNPGLFEVLAYESILALRQIISSGADTRIQLRDDLENIKVFYGSMGNITISNKREFLRSMQIIKMKDHTLYPLSFTLFKK